MDTNNIEEYILTNHPHLSFSILASFGLYQLDIITYVFNESGYRWVQQGFLSEYDWTNLHYQLILAHQALGYSTITLNNTINRAIIPSLLCRLPVSPILQQQQRRYRVTKTNILKQLLHNKSILCNVRTY